MHLEIRKVKLERNMANNKSERYRKDIGINIDAKKQCRNIRKLNYFGTHCIKHDNNWKVVSSFVPDTLHRDGNFHISNENNEIVNDPFP